MSDLANFVVITGRSSGAGKETIVRGVEELIFREILSSSSYTSQSQKIEIEQFIRLCGLTDYLSGIITQEEYLSKYNEFKLETLSSLEQESFFNINDKSKNKKIVEDISIERHKIRQSLKNVLPYGWIPSHATREMRKGEIQGFPYEFVSVKEFEELLEQGGYLEFFDQSNYSQDGSKAYKGTPKFDVDYVLTKGKTGMKEMEINGAFQTYETCQNKELVINPLIIYIHVDDDILV